MITCLNHKKDGYLLDGNKCKPDESDECALAPPRYPCDENAICTNLDVGYSCECKKGEVQDPVGHSHMHLVSDLMVLVSVVLDSLK